MLKVGITGGIGSGKTTVSKLFNILGIPVYNADSRAKALMQSDHELIAGIKEAFSGIPVYDDQNKLNRKELAATVFNNQTALDKLNNIVHPAVKADFNKWVVQYEDCLYIVKEAALLFESGSYKELDYVICVNAPVELCIERAMQRDGNSREDILARMKNQMPLEEKCTKSDLIINNDEQQLIIPQVLQLHNQFR